MVDLNRIDAFVQVMDAGSFSAAARALGQPKSSLSRAVSKLERELGVVLLQRTTRRLAITEAGQLYLERARSALGMLADARARLIDTESEPRGVVRFTGPPDDSGNMLAGALASFATAYPAIHVECLITQRRVDLVAEGVDLALRAGRLDDASLVGKKLGDTPLALYASPDYLAARGTPRKLAQLAQHDCVLFRGARGRARWTLSGKRGHESVEVSGPINVDDLGAACQLALRGVGIAFLPTTFGQRGVSEGKLVRVLPSMQAEGGAVYLVHPATPHLPRRVALLRDHLYASIKPMFEACTGHL
ncbi:MAG TPA: LysR family transcriptional regulator [Polyangiales bacterium]|nr:LysR family transcriptional regulator [Polyangiales bacterium]